MSAINFIVVDRKSNKQKMLKDAEPYEGYWQDSYEFVFDRIKKRFFHQDFTRALEFGAGNGEFFKYYADCFEKVVAVEENWKSRDRAMENAYWSDRKHIEFRDSSQDAEDLNPGFDVVLIGQSFRHMTLEQSQDSISKATEVLKDQGLLIILAPYKKKRQDTFLRTYLDENEGYCTEPISEEEFESIKKRDESQLKLRRYTKEYFENLQGLELKQVIYFHDTILPSFIDDYLFRDLIINNSIFRGKFGSELAVVLEKN